MLTLTGKFRFLLLTVPLASVFADFRPLEAAEPPDFNREVRPLLSDRCLACHGPDAAHREAELRLDDFKSMTADRGDYAVVVPGKPEASELLKRITSDDEDLVMPPKHLGKSLTEAEVDILHRWIASGAEINPHWAYVPPKNQPTPEVKTPEWPIHWVDNFVLARMETEGLQPSPGADPVTLMRRVHFDLTGLPPQPKVVAAFAQDPSDEAYEKVVDQLLASDAATERMAMYWLDLVRYADTVGYHGDQDHNISPYRDWVIDAFAQNMPFDQFTREQLAGDLLPDSTVDQKIASGYNRLLQTSHEGGIQPKEYLSIYAADRVRNVSAVWMGATVGCAQCHDHKFDPYTAKDFYSLAAFFADLDEDQHFRDGSNALPTKRAPELKVHSRRERAHLTKLKHDLADVERQLKKSPDNKDLVDRRKQLGFAIDDLENAARLTMISVAKEPREMRLLARGNWLDDSGPIVSPSIPEFLGETPTANSSRATRLDLANWLCDAENGAGLLTARVFANRFWYLMFGGGIAADLDDFGGQGTPPEHPELLDQLALEFVNSDWNVREMLRLIVTSRTYRQSSAWTDELLEKDPGNTLYARQSAFRLPAEMVRDNALEVSGLLVHKVGGPSVRPYQPAGYYRHLNFPVRKYAHHTDDRQWRRGLYVHWQRQFLHPMLKAFDAPTREECTAQRSRSNTPLAALTLLNDPTFVEVARAFADRILTETDGKSDDSRFDHAMQLATSRLPDARERQLFSDLLQASRSYYKAHPAEAEKALGVGLAPQPKRLDSVEMASWMAVSRAILNLDETITRN
ncbi:PSD1 and planctomycete cytochrome C domain-containing protein [Fuerstiella marisgermanici]|uniref:Planctomycete cytochrome C n=1 Tax=Fuerstiella marisgermanici TaxID=1891926 RepID=A0A1P8WKW0_9PLAN|nr:PSD1 and planctomycete cytochrome C domain-containing protein [Fuerstiella marisgermanici]APZ94702.1 Planctomycete cytochrome C [Fuerstiella marisgermanici]